MRSTPMSRPASITASASVGEMCPVWTTSFLRGADFEHVTHRGKNLSVGTNHLDAFRCILEMLDMIVCIEGGEPDHASEPALHAPHPVDRVKGDSANGRIEDDPAEYLQAGHILRANQARSAVGTT